MDGNEMTTKLHAHIKACFESSDRQTLMVHSHFRDICVWVRVEDWLVPRMEQTTGKSCREFTLLLDSGESILPLRYTTFLTLMASADNPASPTTAIAQLFPANQLH
jgi:hypothetical protein